MPPTADHILKDATVRLTDAGIESPRLDARLLFEAATGWSRADLVADPLQEVEKNALETFERLLVRRLDHEPVSRILGRREFWGLSFEINDATLDPRPDTETVVQTVLDWRATGSDLARPRILDLGTGSGCILISLLTEWPEASGVGIDIAENAIKAACDNAGTNGVSDRANFRVGNWTDGIDERFDVVVSNPPYIKNDEIDFLDADVRLFEPRAALAGGEDGLDFVRRLAKSLDEIMASEGVAVIEIGFGQARAAAETFERKGFRVRCTKDLSGIERCLKIERK